MSSIRTKLPRAG